MSMMINKLRPLIIVAFLLVAWLFTPLGNIPTIFVKLDSLRLTYAVFFFGTLLASLFLFRDRIDRASWLQALLIATLGGYLVSILSLLGAELLMPDGVQLVIKTFRTNNLSTLLIAELFFPCMLLGWLVAPLAVFALKIGKKRATDNN
jgi:hypothetical protein